MSETLEQVFSFWNPRSLEITEGEGHDIYLYCIRDILQLSSREKKLPSVTYDEIPG